MINAWDEVLELLWVHNWLTRVHSGFCMIDMAWDCGSKGCIIPSEIANKFCFETLFNTV
jgi:hypothetical protein